MSLLYNTTSDEIKTINGINKGLTALLKASSIRSLEFFLSHFKKVLLKLYWLLIFSLYKQRNIILVGNSCIFGKTVVFVLYFARSNSVFLKEKVVIFFYQYL